MKKSSIVISSVLLLFVGYFIYYCITNKLYLVGGILGACMVVSIILNLVFSYEKPADDKRIPARIVDYDDSTIMIGDEPALAVVLALYKNEKVSLQCVDTNSLYEDDYPLDADLYVTINSRGTVRMLEDTIGSKFSKKIDKALDDFVDKEFA